jgi:small subunit ribosomal protein S4
MSRRFGVDIYGTGGAALMRRLGTPPGARVSRRRRISQFGQQLREKQKAKGIYGVAERQFRRYYETAGGMPGNRGENLLTLLERRLDNVVYRLGFARTRPMARQLVGHGHVSVDGRRVTIPSFRVEAGQEITLANVALGMPVVEEELTSGRPVPEWLERTPSGGRVLRLPTRADIDVPVDEGEVIGFYSR